MPAGRIFPATLKLKGTLTVVDAIAEFVAKAAVAAIADAKRTFLKIDCMCETSCLVHHTSDLQEDSRQVSVQKTSNLQLAFCSRLVPAIVSRTIVGIEIRRANFRWE